MPGMCILVHPTIGKERCERNGSGQQNPERAPHRKSHSEAQIDAHYEVSEVQPAMGGPQIAVEGWLGIRIRIIKESVAHHQPYGQGSEHYTRQPRHDAVAEQRSFKTFHKTT